MEVKGIIGQIIKWEDRGKYFTGYDFGKEEKDLIVIGHTKKHRFYQGGLIAIFLSLIGVTWKIYECNDIVFNSNAGITIPVKRPHNFKLMDKVKIKIEVEGI